MRSRPHCTLATLLVLAILLSALPAWAAELAGRVVGLADGDTITLLTPERRQVRVRLGEIDTPESRQPYGTRARQAIADLVCSATIWMVLRVNQDDAVTARRRDDGCW